MNTKSFVSTTIVVWIVNSVLATMLNMFILNWDDVPGAKSSEMMGAADFIFIYLGALAFSVFFTLIFIKGYEGKGVGEGVRYGIYVGLLINMTEFLIRSGTTTMPGSILWGYHVGMTIVCIVMGVAAAAMYKPANS